MLAACTSLAPATGCAGALDLLSYQTCLQMDAVHRGATSAHERPPCLRQAVMFQVLKSEVPGQLIRHVLTRPDPHMQHIRRLHPWAIKWCPAIPGSVLFVAWQARS